MLIIALLLFGIVAGGVAQLILGRSMDDIDWTTAVVTGLLGSSSVVSRSVCLPVTGSSCAQPG